MDDIELQLCLEIYGNSKDSLESILKDKKYYGFRATEKYINQSGKVATPNSIFFCNKTIERSEISNIHKVGDDLKKMQIGVKSVVTRSYSEKPIKRRNKLFEFIHTIIVGITVVGIVLGIDALHPKILTPNEIASIIGIPIIIDGLYALVRLWTRK